MDIMSMEFIPRDESTYQDTKPLSPRERSRMLRIKKILKKYAVKGSDEELERVAIEIWREARH